jgi:hypothetical protein
MFCNASKFCCVAVPRTMLLDMHVSFWMVKGRFAASPQGPSDHRPDPRM